MDIYIKAFLGGAYTHHSNTAESRYKDHLKTRAYLSSVSAPFSSCVCIWLQMDMCEQPCMRVPVHVGMREMEHGGESDGEDESVS